MSIDVTIKKNIIFDLDGTLIDSNSLHEKAFREALDGKKINFNYENFHGVKTLDVFKSLGFASNEAQYLTNKKQMTYRGYVDGGYVNEFSSSTILLKLLIKNDLKLFLCTGASRKSVEKILLKFSWKGLFEDTICGDEVDRSKPDPFILDTIIKRNNLTKENILYVEDSDKGLETGINAGVDTVVVNNVLDGAKISFKDIADFYDYFHEFLSIKDVA
jgi:beta-phosphoglucomutase